MLKLKTTFYLYNNEINEQIKKSITSKYIEQIAQCILTDITKNSEQAEINNIKGGEEGEKVC